MKIPSRTRRGTTAGATRILPETPRRHKAQVDRRARGSRPAHPASPPAPPAARTNRSVHPPPRPSGSHAEALTAAPGPSARDIVATRPLAETTAVLLPSHRPSLHSAPPPRPQAVAPSPIDRKSQCCGGEALLRAPTGQHLANFRFPVCRRRRQAMRRTRAAAIRTAVPAAQQTGKERRLSQKRQASRPMKPGGKKQLKPHGIFVLESPRRLPGQCSVHPVARPAPCGEDCLPHGTRAFSESRLDTDASTTIMASWKEGKVGVRAVSQRIEPVRDGGAQMLDNMRAASHRLGFPAPRRLQPPPAMRVLPRQAPGGINHAADGLRRKTNQGRMTTGQKGKTPQRDKALPEPEPCLLLGRHVNAPGEPTVHRVAVLNATFCGATGFDGSVATLKKPTIACEAP